MRPDQPMHHRGLALDMSAQAFGALRSSRDIVDDMDSLRCRFQEDGYLYLPEFLDRALVLEARLGELEKFAGLGYLDPAYPVMEGVVHEKYRTQAASPYAEPELDNSARRNPALMQVLYAGAMIDFYEELFGEEVRHFDYTWHRAKTASDESASPPHCDIVFMGRGSHRLCTSWTPLGDIPIPMGGLMVLEGSHRLEHLKSTYGRMDVDTYCTNHEDAADIEAGKKQWQDRVNSGAFHTNAVETRSALGGRWLTTDYRAGDLLVFSMFTMHASMDNQTCRFRLSTDTRYQPASDPIDERWVGETPIKHGPEGKIGMIC